MTLQNKATITCSYNPYRAYIPTILNFGSDAVSSQLDTQLFCMDDSNSPGVSDPSGTKNGLFERSKGWSGGAMVLGKLPVPGRPTILNTVGQGPTALAVGAGGGCLDIFALICPFSSLSPSLWETARYRLKYCLKGPLNPKPTNNREIQDDRFV